MEYDRLGGNTKLFIFGVICLVISLGLLFFSLYILPYFIWELGYNMPDFVLNMLAMYQDDYHYTSAGSKTIVWLIFFIPCVITGFISYFISNYLDKQTYGSEIMPEPQQRPAGEIPQQIKESASLGGKILALMILIVVVLLLLQYFVQLTV